MIIKPIIPIWIMAIICVVLIMFRHRERPAFIRQLIIVLLLFVLNLRPMIAGSESQIKVKKLNVYTLFVVDDTISMVARDYDEGKPRLDGVKADCEYIAKKLSGVKYGAITFNNSANIVSPFTYNMEHIVNVINAISPINYLYAQGSNLNTAKELTVSTLKKIKDEKDAKVVLFFISDGENTDGKSMESFKELKSLVDAGAVLGYGTEEGGKMYVESGFDGILEEVKDYSTWDFAPAISKLEEDNLKKLAKDIGIDYVHMTETEQIDKVLDDVIEETFEEGYVLQEYDNTYGAKDIYYVFLIPLLIMCLIDGVCMIKKTV